MAMKRDGETWFKVVCIGPRGVPAKLLARVRDRWEVEGFHSEDGLGEPGEPVIDFSMCHVGFEGAKRIYFFGHGIDPLDFVTLGPQTRGAMLKGADRIVVTLGAPDGAGPFVETLERARSEDEGAPVEVAMIAFAGTDASVAGVPADIPVAFVRGDDGRWLEELAQRVLRSGVDLDR